MVKELQSNKETYVGFVHELEKYEESDRQFLQPGVFLGDTGDFMAKATYCEFAQDACDSVNINRELSHYKCHPG